METQIRITATPSQVDPTQCTFQVERPIFPDQSFHFGSEELANRSPLAKELFAIGGIASIHISHDEIRVSASQVPDWRDLGKKVGTTIREMLASDEVPVPESVFDDLIPADKIQHLVEQVLDTQVNPMVAQHGGIIRLLDVKKNVVYIEMGGGCQGCGMASATLKDGVERLIREFVPEVGDILDVTDHASGRNPYFTPA